MTRIRLKKLEDQVLVITGATSGIGLCTARAAAARGAKLALVARNEEDLSRIADEINHHGGNAIAIGADVSDAQALYDVRDKVLARFGGFDTWVNNAGISIYGRLEDVDLVEARRLFEVNFWGVVNGCRAALSHFAHFAHSAPRGGAIINVGSALSDRVLPLQGMYGASKHAVKAYSDALRMELEMQDIPVSISLVKPSTTNTPYAEHARNYLEVAPRNPPPVYAPELVADAILFCAEHPRRDVIVGGGAKLVSVLEKVAPALTDRLMVRTMGSLQRSTQPRHGDDIAYFSRPCSKGTSAGRTTGGCSSAACIRR